ncbi:MAG: hypothetical protein K2Y22_08060 [Candidatus Obscuribacterales bacterium]|nr:hypothetical protein [Candidatus Obscuribacterales bacterium]
MNPPSILTSLSLFLWVFAEGSFFFVLPDVLLAPLAAKYPQSWLKLVAVCIVGTLTGSLIPFFLAKTDPAAGYYLLQKISLVSPPKIERVIRTLNDLGYLSFLLQPFSLIPLKAFVFEASRSSYSPLAIFASVFVGRTLRNATVAFLASYIGTKYRDQIRSRKKIFLAIWIFFCMCLVGAAMWAP